MALGGSLSGLRLRLNFEIVATLCTVVAIGVATFMISSVNPRAGPYLSLLLSLAMAIPIFVYLRARRSTAEATRTNSAEKISAPVIEEPAPAKTAPVAQAPSITQPEAAQPTPSSAPDSGAALNAVRDQLSTIDSHLLQLVNLSSSILETVGQTSGATGIPGSSSPSGMAQAGSRPAEKPRGAVTSVESVQSNDDASPEEPSSERAREKSSPGDEDSEDSAEGGVKVKRVENLDQIKKKSTSTTRMDELNILREELVKLRSKLDVPEKQQQPPKQQK